MPNIVLSTHVYVVRIWIENLQSYDLSGALRGVVESVPAGERRYFSNLDEMKSIIASFVQKDMSSEG